MHGDGWKAIKQHSVKKSSQGEVEIEGAMERWKREMGETEGGIERGRGEGGHETCSVTTALLLL